MTDLLDVRALKAGEKVIKDPRWADDPAPYRCGACGLRGPSTTGLAGHYFHAHVSVPVNCDICGKHCVSSVGLANHKRAKHVLKPEAEIPTDQPVTPDKPAKRPYVKKTKEVISETVVEAGDSIISVLSRVVNKLIIDTLLQIEGDIDAGNYGFTQEQ
jgi:hypothetical protein